MTSFTAPQTPAGRYVMKYLKKLEKKSSNRKQHIGRMSKRIESKDHTIRRLRGQRDILRRVAQAPVKEVQENNEGNEVLAHVKAVHGRGNDKREELLDSALRQIKNLEMHLDQVRAKLEDEKNKNLYLQAQLQPVQEAQAETEEIGMVPAFMDEPHFTMSPVVDTYACAIARQNALAVQVAARFENDSATTEAIQGITGRKSLPGEAEDQGGFHFIRGVFGTRALTA